MAAPFRPAAGGSYFRKSENDKPVLVERTDAKPADLAPMPTPEDSPAADVPGDPETEAPKGRRKGR